MADSYATPSAGGVTPWATLAGMTWDATPKLVGLATPTPKKQRSRWDGMPVSMGSATVLPDATATPPAVCTPVVTPIGGTDLPTSTPEELSIRGKLHPSV